MTDGCAHIFASVGESRPPRSDNAYTYCVCQYCLEQDIKLAKDRKMDLFLGHLQIAAAHKKHGMHDYCECQTCRTQPRPPYRSCLCCRGIFAHRDSCTLDEGRAVRQRFKG